MRVGFKTTLDEELLSKIKIKAIQEKVNVNDILEELIKKYLDQQIILELKRK